MFSKKHFITEDIPDLTGKVAIVTGGNSGIGYTTARELTRKNAHVFIASRSKERGEGAVEKIKKETGKSQVEYLHLDLSNLKNVKKSAENFLSKNLSLHILINNAGIVNSWSLTEDGIQNEFGVNHVGHFLFTMTLLAKIEASAPSRIVIVSSTAHGYTEGIEFDKINQEATQSTWQRYCISKLSNVLFTKSLSKRVEGKEVYVNSVHPGFVDTSIARGFKSGFFVAKVLKCASKMSSSKGEKIDTHLTLTSTDLATLLKQADKTKFYKFFSPKNSIQSGNNAIDDLVTFTQLNANNNTSHYLEWIDFDRFEDIHHIGQGGFSTVYRAKWINEKLNSSNHNEVENTSSVIIALKSLHNSKDVKSDFFQEFKLNFIRTSQENENNCIKIYGITQDNNTKDYMIVMQYAEEGNLRQYLKRNYKNLKWYNKLNFLSRIASSISEMHKILILHRDLHLGNILKEKDVFLSDTGLNGSCIVRGVLPYMAPELLHNQPYTKKADLYSFGIIMAELTTGKPPFEDRLFDHHLAIDICKGLRPKFAKETPECYIALVKRLLDADPTKRPEAEEILMIINSWIKIFHESNENLSKEELIIKNEFDISNELISNLPDEINVSKYREPYISKIINFINLPIPVNLQDHSEGSQV
ncbi:14713_t:CDS:2 [Funneliformis geosporum]|nr:14713_t:CDS:2 [Funneliformis geosporum]